MNAHQRKKRAAAHHYRMPLGCAVRVRCALTHETFDGTMAKHDKSSCIVHFSEHNRLSLAANDVATIPFAWVSYFNVRPLTVNRVRPWWRVTREKHRAQAQGRK